MRAVRIRETFVIREAAMARLDVYDPELYRAVSWVQAKDTKRTGPLSRVRAEFRPPGPEPHLGAVYWRFLRATEFLTAEVAERQTR